MNYQMAILRVSQSKRYCLLVALLTTFFYSSALGQSDNQQQDPQQPTIKIPTALVTVPVIVTDRYGRFITGLERDDFIIREDGVLQKIDDFSSTEAPFNVALLIDTSRSTQNKLNTIRKAALSFIKQLQPNDRVMIVTFDEQVRFVSDFTSNRGDLERAVKTLRSSYLTSLYDAIYRTITEKMLPVQGRKAIVVLTDGVDTASKKASFQDVIETVAATGVISYAIQYETRNDGGPVMKPLLLPRTPFNSFVSASNAGSVKRLLQNPPQSPSKSSSEKNDQDNQGKKDQPNPIINIPRPTFETGEGQSPRPPASPASMPSTRVNSQAQQPIRDRYLIAADFLKSLAAQSGALYIRAESIENTSFAFQRIAEELRHQYTLTYISTNDQKDGNYRTIAVRTNRSDFIVRARLGYRVPKVDEQNDDDEKKPEDKSKP